MSEEERAALTRAIEQLQGLAEDLDREPAPDIEVAAMAAYEHRTAERLRHVVADLEAARGA